MIRSVFVSLPVVVALGLAGCSADASTTKAAGTSAGTGVKQCNASRLPAQVSDTVEAIRAGGPFIRRKQDGSTYQNRNRALPVKANGFYREYTVQTPGASNAGTRRVVTGGNPKKNPPWFFYTGDHYNTFCQLSVK